MALKLIQQKHSSTFGMCTLSGLHPACCAGFGVGATFERESFLQRTPEDLLTNMNRALCFAEDMLVDQEGHAVYLKAFSTRTGRLVLIRWPHPSDPQQCLRPGAVRVIQSDDDAEKQQLRDFAALRGHAELVGALDDEACYMFSVIV